MLAGPGPAWAQVELSLGNDELPAAMAWLQRRAAGIRRALGCLMHERHAPCTCCVLADIMRRALHTPCLLAARKAVQPTHN